MEIKKAPYGYCPICGNPGVNRERRYGGNDICSKEHIYPSADALSEQPNIAGLIEENQRLRELLTKAVSFFINEQKSILKEKETEKAFLEKMKKILTLTGQVAITPAGEVVAIFKPE